MKGLMVLGYDGIDIHREYLLVAAYYIIYRTER